MDRPAGWFKDAIIYVETPEFHYSNLNVGASENNLNSLLHWMRDIIQLRKDLKVMGRGSFSFADADHPSIPSYWREYQGENILEVINLNDMPQKTRIDLIKPGYSGTLQDLFSNRIFNTADGTLILNLNPYQFRWLREYEAETLELVEKKMAISLN